MSKRSRKSKGESSSSVPQPELDTLGIHFTTTLQGSIFKDLIERKMTPTKFVCQATLAKLGITDGVRTLLGNIGCPGLFTAYAPTYRRVTLEFLSSFTCDWDERRMQFSVYGENYTLTFDEASHAFGCLPDDEGVVFGPPDNYGIDFSSNDFWNLISGNHSRYNSQGSKATNVRHPCLRIAHRILTCTLMCRHDAGTVLLQELYLLHAMTIPGRLNLDFGAFLAQKFWKTRDADSGIICCGGLITYLLKESNLQIEIPDEEEQLVGDDQLTIQVLKNMKMIKQEGRRFSWIYGFPYHHHSYLPDIVRTRIDENTDWSYPPDGQEEEDQQPPQNIDQRINELTLQVGENTRAIQGVQHTLDHMQRNMYGFFEHMDYNPYYGP